MEDYSSFVDVKNKLQEKVKNLDDELEYQGRVLYELFQEKNKHLKINTTTAKSALPENHNILFHYKYILPLVKEIHLLELEVKQSQVKLEERNLKYEAGKQGKQILAESLCSDDCVLRKCAEEIIHLSKTTKRTDELVSDSCSVSNISYNTSFTEENVLEESLAFTALHKGVHVRVRIKSKTPFFSKHFLPLTEEVSLKVDSDTYIEGLKEKILAVINGTGGSLKGVVEFVSRYIENDMAPFVIIIPMRKKKKQKK